MVKLTQLILHICDEMNVEQKRYEFHPSNSRIVSMDIKALYPIMRWLEILKAVREMIKSSDMFLDNANWHEIGKYLAVMMSEEEIREEGLYNVIP